MRQENTFEGILGDTKNALGPIDGHKWHFALHILHIYGCSIVPCLGIEFPSELVGLARVADSRPDSRAQSSVQHTLQESTPILHNLVLIICRHLVMIFLIVI